MEIILLERVENLGAIGDVVKTRMEALQAEPVLDLVGADASAVTGTSGATGTETAGAETSTVPGQAGPGEDRPARRRRRGGRGRGRSGGATDDSLDSSEQPVASEV